MRQAARCANKAPKRSYRKYNKLNNGSKFRYPNDNKVYIKICDAFSLDTATGKDMIPSLFDHVIFCGYQDGYYPLFNA